MDKDRVVTIKHVQARVPSDVADELHEAYMASKYKSMNEFLVALYKQTAAVRLQSSHAIETLAA